jgi:hypothetical protein
MVSFIVQHLNIHYERTVNTQQHLLVNVLHTNMQHVMKHVLLEAQIRREGQASE